MFLFGQTVQRLRAALVTDTYSGDQVAAGWASPAVLAIPGAFVAQSSTARFTAANRTQMLEDKSLFCAPGTDVLPGDRIRVDGLVYEVDGVPAADVNPFTGWQPVREVPLTRVVG